MASDPMVAPERSLDTARLQVFFFGSARALRRFAVGMLRDLFFFKRSTEDVFAKIDADGKGMVLLIEWCKWLEAGEIEAGTMLGEALNVGDED